MLLVEHSEDSSGMRMRVVEEVAGEETTKKTLLRCWNESSSDCWGNGVVEIGWAWENSQTEEGEKDCGAVVVSWSYYYYWDDGY